MSAAGAPVLLTGADELRLIVRNMGNVPEAFNDRYNVEQLVAIYRALLRCGWDIGPHQWTDYQVEAAIAGQTPRFDDSGAPL